MKNQNHPSFYKPNADEIRQAAINMRGDHIAAERLRTALYVWRLECLRNAGDKQRGD